MTDNDRSARLRQFVEWCTENIQGDEKGEAQIFLDRLFQAFGQPGSRDVGGTPEFRIKPGKEDDRGTSFADYVWKAKDRPGVLIEMKKRGVDLAKTRQQAFNYWIKLVPNRPQYTILCNFDEFWIYDFNVDLDEPLDKLSLRQLPDRYGPLAFLFPTNDRPTFENDRIEVTRKAADRLAAAFFHMTHVRKVDRDLAQRFILQLLVALFAEDIDLLPKYFVANLLADIKTPEDSYDLLGSLFEAMNRKDGTPAGRFKGIRYFNGGLFREPARLALDKDNIELNHIRSAAKENWSKVSPEIFGTLFQHSMDSGERHAYGAHYTAPIDIMKIVRPTIVEPWTQLIDNAKTPKKLADLLERLSLYKVLDPACGSGNFLYIAYRELKRLESKIRDRLRSEFPDFQATLHHVTARQFFGMDILPFAIELAKVTMMIARKLAIDELHIADEPPLPLDNLDQNFLCTDALVDTNGFVNRWPTADAIIGNPPFLGAKRLKPERGPDYVNALRKLYPEVPGMADYCVYWFRRAHDHLPPCTPDRPESGRAGLVGTQNIRNNQSRVGGLDHIVKSGTIIEAVDNQPWSGEANVHVSIANWVKTGDSHDPPSPRSAPRVAPSQRDAAPPGPSKLLIPNKKKLWFKIDPRLALFSQTDRSRDRPGAVVTTTGKRGKVRQDKSYELDYRLTDAITSTLSDKIDASFAKELSVNTAPQRVFQGMTPGYDGFILQPNEAEAFFRKSKLSRKIIKPYLIGRELVSGDGTPQRFIIDTDDLNLTNLPRYPEVFKHLQEHVLPDVRKKIDETKDKNADMVGAREDHLQRWWTFWARRTKLRAWSSKHDRIIAGSRTQRIPFVFQFISTDILPGDKLQLFAFDDDYSFGILHSSAHCSWYQAKASRLKNEADYNYSTDSIFDTFPWPQSPTKKQIDAIADAGRLIRKVRADALQKITGGLRALYRTLELPGKNPLKDAHAQLDKAVLAAYNFPEKDDLLTQLLALNLEVAAKIDTGQAVTAPGVPSLYGDAVPLVTHDCIQP
ncbi:MAG TPA: DNA methyltransferase [Phycisphaerae bacterium]|nr:DNA methyltransferase [Phycisphaerae bacterium]